MRSLHRREFGWFLAACAVGWTAALCGIWLGPRQERFPRLKKARRAVVVVMALLALSVFAQFARLFV